MEILDIFGKKYRVQSGLNSDEISRINREIVKRLRTLALEYPSLDRMDALVLYIVELNEKITDMEKKVSREKDKLERVKKRIIALEGKIREVIKKV
ncbi:MAG: cell division protein ZapA [Candidatus Omnitrophica bacterium]|nr:cell division protein ZapA [Candidatus Omnitrophota bacterium]